MKKDSKVIKRDYTLPKNNDPRELYYYGVFIKDGRVKVDTKRYKKFFELPDVKIEIRNTVYFEPKFKHKTDYICNIFRDRFERSKFLWLTEFSNAIKAIKTTKQVEDNTRFDLIVNNVETVEDAYAEALIKGVKRIPTYKYVIKSLYAQFFHQMMSEMDALTLRVLLSLGYKERDFTKAKFDVYIQSRQGKEAVRFLDFDNFKVYDRAYCVWNFLKHNSLKAYEILCNFYPEMIYDPDKKYKNGDLALSVLKLDEKFIINTLNNLHLFFDEVCEKAFGENTKDAYWNYDDYFCSVVKEKIKEITDPFD